MSHNEQPVNMQAHMPPDLYVPQSSWLYCKNSLKGTLQGSTPLGRAYLIHGHAD